MKRGQGIGAAFWLLLMMVGVVGLAGVLGEAEQGQRDYESVRQAAYGQGAAVTAETDEVVDFAALAAINDEVVGWLRLAGTAIDYPVVQAVDNVYYVAHTFTRQRHKVGSIFLDYRNSGDFADGTSIIYGHNLKTGEMFSELMDFQRADFWQAHPEVMLTTPQESLVFRIEAVRTVADDDALYEVIPGQQSEDGVRRLILSTCTNRTEHERLVIIAQQVEK